jgi:hypothetical protein
MIPAIKLYQIFPGLVEWAMVKAMRNSRSGEAREGKEK